MFENKYIDQKEINTFFSQNKYAEIFKNLLITKRKYSYGDHKGELKKDILIEKLYAVTSDIQYQIKKLAGSAVNWFEVQHIILAYMKTAIEINLVLNKDNLLFFINEILKYSNADGKLLFTYNQIVQVLTVLHNMKAEELYFEVFNPVKYFNAAGASLNSGYSYSIDQTEKTAGGINPIILVLGGVAVIYFLTKNKKK